MTTTPGWKVVGFVGASATEPAFVLPVLRRDGGNALVVQRIDEHGRISEFEPLDDAAADTVTHVHSPFQRHIGAPPLWAFRLTPNDHLVAEQPELRAYLAERLDAPELRAAPLVRLRVIQFIGRDDLLTDALRDAYALMQTLPDGTARFWRDNVVLAQRCRDVLREKGIPEDTIDMEVREGVLWIQPLDEIAAGVDWAQALKLYVDAFGLRAEVSLLHIRKKQRHEIAAITTLCTKSWHALSPLARRDSLPLARVDTIESIKPGQYSRIYLFIDGGDIPSPVTVNRLSRGIAPTPLHLLWVDCDQCLPVSDYIDTVAAITILPAHPLWARDNEHESTNYSRISDLLRFFMHMAAANGFQHKALSTFVTAASETFNHSLNISQNLWVSSVNKILPPWDATHLTHTGDIEESKKYLFEFKSITKHEKNENFNMPGGTITHLYEANFATKNTKNNDVGYEKIFNELNWKTKPLYGKFSFEIRNDIGGLFYVTILHKEILNGEIWQLFNELRAAKNGNHIIIPIGERPNAKTMIKMIAIGLDVILPHRLPLLANPLSEWAVTYALMTQFSGKNLEEVIKIKFDKMIKRYLMNDNKNKTKTVEIKRIEFFKKNFQIGGSARITAFGTNMTYSIIIYFNPEGPEIRSEYSSYRL